MPATSDTVSISRNLPISIDTDILVLGGGPAGVAAALSAARSGARVALIERMGFCGGAGTAMQVPAFAPFSDRTRAIVRGIGWEILIAMQAELGKPLPDPDSYAVPQDDGRMDWAPIDVEILKRIYDRLLADAGVEIRYHTFAPDVVKDESGAISGVVLAGKDGLSVATARVFIDATGDADIAARAGFSFHFGDESGDQSGATQGMTMCFTVGGGSRTEYLKYVHATGDGYLAACVARATRGNAWDLPDISLVGMSFKDETTAGCNMGHIYGSSPLDPNSLSRAEIDGRAMAAKLVAFLRAYVPGQDNVVLLSTGPHIGVRESRRIVGEYTLTLDDYLACRSFPDEIARCAYFIDLHAATSEDATRAKSISDSRKSYALPPGESHGIPLRCLIPKGAKNLLVAGRTISCERAVAGAIRVMPYAFATGEAAGIAAALSIEQNLGVADIDPETVRAILRNRGAYLPV